MTTKMKPQKSALVKPSRSNHSKTISRISYVARTYFKNIKDIRKNYSLTIMDIASVLDVTPKTLTRWTSNGLKKDTLSPQKADSINVLRSILELGESVLGDQARVNHWLRSSVSALDGKQPLDFLKTESGRRRVETVLHQIEYGVY